MSRSPLRPWPLTRRQLLAGLGALTGTAPLPAWAFGDTTEVDVAELDLGPGTLSRPNGWKRMLYEVVQTTSVECEPRAVRVKPDSAELFAHPFSVVIGDAAFAEPSDRAVEQLERYLSYGGFLLFDDATGTESNPFDTEVRKLVRRLFPTAGVPSNAARATTARSHTTRRKRREG